MPSATITPQHSRPLADSEIRSNPPDLSKQIPRLVPRSKPFKKRTAPSQQPQPSQPIQTPSLPSPPALHGIHFSHPTRRILSNYDHTLFLNSPTHNLITSFILNLSDAVRDTSISTVRAQFTASPNPVCAGILTILDEADHLIDSHPPDHTSGSRFGNPLFRDYLASIFSLLTTWHTTNIPTTTTLPAPALDELTTYLGASLGSASRIDYGSGHELHFLIYLLCFLRLSLLPADQHLLRIFALLILPRYLRLMRRLQATYYLEPAGSHGVWGLDDYQFAPFLLGASQLVSHPFITPLGIHSTALVDAYADDYLYLDMVRHVNATKTVQGLRWHSPMLDDISGAKGGWAKVETGMRKMLEGEVLGKLVVMQHFLFGGIVQAAEGMTEAEKQEGGELETEEGHEGHDHKPDGWDDCCGIRVPGNVGAVEEMKRRMGGKQELRRLPFD